MYPLSSFYFTDSATDVFVEYGVGCRHGQLEAKSAFANPQASKKGKKQSTSNCLRMLAMQDQRSAFMGQDDSPAYFPVVSYVHHHTPKLEQLETLNPGVQACSTDLEGKPGGSGWRNSTKAPASSPLQPSSFCCLRCLHTGPW
jgi:hypothetical protein